MDGNHWLSVLLYEPKEPLVTRMRLTDTRGHSQQTVSKRPGEGVLATGPKASVLQLEVAGSLLTQAQNSHQVKADTRAVRAQC